MGQEYVVEEAGTGGRRSAPARSYPGDPVLHDTGDVLKLLEQWRKELSGYIAELKTLCDMDPDEAMRWMAGTSGRVAEIRDLSWDITTNAATQIRAKRIEPLIDEIDRQFRIASRRLTSFELDLKMSGGGT